MDPGLKAWDDGEWLERFAKLALDCAGSVSNGARVYAVPLGSSLAGRRAASAA
ncbi:hypothetical protein RHECNPAF_6080010 [Rhizobium etli CNPAF512]|nr:hypothetical protein RHECNPAF_6080010 [Rhizobium etli CNPAF512]